MIAATSVMKVSNCNSLWDVCIHDMHVLHVLWREEKGEKGVKRERERESGRQAVITWYLETII